MSSALLDLPYDALRSVALHLEAPDVLSLLSTHREFKDSIGTSAPFWQELACRDFDLPGNGEESYQTARDDYLTKAYVSHLPSVRWYPIRRIPSNTVSAREGHLTCVLPGPYGEDRVFITGGFCDDETVYMMRVPKKNCQSSLWTWTRLTPGNGRPSFTYGASLTALDATMKDGCHVARAIRFGGFRSGGYSSEVNQVWLMTVRSEPTSSSGEYPWKTSISWELVPTTNPQFGAAPRAYHTCTLLARRYLVVLGGMMWRESILDEAILDTQTWTWIVDPISTFGHDKPSGRHGHSVILDNRRSRLLVFGGGSGTDLLRDGRDNGEVWELKMNHDWDTNLRLPWTWHNIYKDACDKSGSSEEAYAMEGDDEAGNSDFPSMKSRSSPTTLSPAEALCIGRCHHGIKVSPDTAVFLFGSGRPSTNGLIGYDLRTDRFVRPEISGALPTPRFSGVAAYLESEGYIIAQGGYSSYRSDCIDDLTVLDLAPSMKRNFTSLPVDVGRHSHHTITDQDAEQGRNRFGGNGIAIEQHQFLTQIIALTHGGSVSPELGHLLASTGIVYNNAIIDNEDDDEDSDVE